MTKPLCSVEGCDRTASRRGWCFKHYRQWYDHASDDEVRRLPRNQTDDQRFWAKVDKNGPIPAEAPDLGPCWIWTGGLLAHSGYGHFWRRGLPKIMAHRWSYTGLVGLIPEGLEIDHLCRVPACVNPAHLEPVTHDENMKRRSAAQTHCTNGHELVEPNLYFVKGRRVCKKCQSARSAAYYQRRKAKK